MRSIRCALDSDGCIDLLAVLKVMNQIDQEQAWAIAYELGKLMQRRLAQSATSCAPIDNLAQVHMHSDGYIHEKSVSRPRPTCPTEGELVASIGIALFWALDYNIPDDEERKLSISMEYLIYQSQTKLGLNELLDICIRRLNIATKTQANIHYRNICKSLVYDTLELSLFLDKIYTATMVLNDIKNQHHHHQQTTTTTSSSPPTTPSPPSSMLISSKTSCKHDIIVDDDIIELGEPLASLRALRINDWARLWMQVIRELRQRDCNRT